MDMEMIMEMIGRFKVRATLFLKENTKAFIIDSMDNWHSCYILEVGEDKVKVREFNGKLEGQVGYINWCDIIKFEAFRERG